MNYTVSKYNTVTEENVQQFNDREIVFNSTGSSTLEVENAILTLENEINFYNAFNTFKNKFTSSEKFMAYDKASQATLVYKWLQNFLKENNNIKEVEYIYSKVNLSDLIEVSILLIEEVLSEVKQFELKRDGELKFTGTENGCYYKLQALQSQSANWAMTHEGWTITEKK